MWDSRRRSMTASLLYPSISRILRRLSFSYLMKWRDESKWEGVIDKLSPLFLQKKSVRSWNWCKKELDWWEKWTGKGWEGKVDKGKGIWRNPASTIFSSWPIAIITILVLQGSLGYSCPMITSHMKLMSHTSYFFLHVKTINSQLYCLRLVLKIKKDKKKDNSDLKLSWNSVFRTIFSKICPWSGRRQPISTQ